MKKHIIVNSKAKHIICSHVGCCNGSCYNCSVAKRKNAYKIKPSDKVYIAGSITDNPNYLEEFGKVQNMLENEFGCIVLNPAKINLPIARLALPYKNISWLAMVNCLSLLSQADVLFVMKNGNNSRGVALEKAFAIYFNIKIVEEL